MKSSPLASLAFVVCGTLAGGVAGCSGLVGADFNDVHPASDAASGDTGAPDGGPPDTGAAEASAPDATPDGDGSIPPMSCPSTLLFSTGTTGGLAFGTNNTVLTDLMNTPGPVTNYEMSVLFPGPVLTAIGDFKAPSAGDGGLALADAWPEDTGSPGGDGSAHASLGPSDGTALRPWLGELGLIPSTCGAVDVTGRTVTVHFYVALLGAVIGIPTNGAFLGSYRSSAMTYYADASLSSVVSTFSDQALTHTFTAAEAADVRDHGLFFRLYCLAETYSEETPVKLSVSEIDWQ